MHGLTNHLVLNAYRNLSEELVEKLAGVIAYEYAQELPAAIKLCQEIATHFPNDAVVNHYLGLLNFHLSDYILALKYFNIAIKIEANPTLYNHVGILYCQLEDFDNAINHYNQALELNPSYGEVYYNLALALTKKYKFFDAEQNLYRAIQHHYISPTLYYNLAYILHQQNKTQQAIVYYQKALELKPNYLECAYNLAEIYTQNKDFKNALIIYNKILNFKSDWSEIYLRIGLIYYYLEQFRKAAEHLETASIFPNLIIYQRLGICYQNLSDFKRAFSAYERGIQLYPDSFELLTDMINLCKNICQWDNLEKLIARAVLFIDRAQSVAFALHILLNFNLEQELAFSKKIASFYQREIKHLQSTINFHFQFQKKRKVRIGYVSSNLRSHPNSHLIKNMLPNHNKDDFEIYLYSTGPRDGSIYSTYIPAYADKFTDLYQDDIQSAVTKIYHDKINILVDLTGYLKYSPARLLALRPAPIQMRFLGSCGTSGAEFIDYLIADKYVVKEDEEKYYSEKIIYMPHTYFITDDQQIIGEETNKKEQGLPEDKLIFCCFNGSRKLEPTTFSSWMKILNQTPSSVLWVLARWDVCKQNLLKEVKKYGVDSERIIFASPLAKEQHLARLKLADLFLDSFYHTAHTTAIDALWVDLPLVTRYGQNIAQRGASSILIALGLPELIATNIKEYEEKAIFLANNPLILKNIQKKIVDHKKNMPLFNTKLYVSYLEAAYMKIWNFYLNNKQPQSIY
jgi:protein O-GlcNAc transferase